MSVGLNWPFTKYVYPGSHVGSFLFEAFFLRQWNSHLALHNASSAYKNLPLYPLFAFSPIYETLLQDLVGMFHLSLVLMFWSFASLLSSSIYRTPPYPFSLWEWIALFLFLNFILFLNFTILYWFCQILKWIRHRYTCVPHPEPSSFLHPCTIPLGCSSALFFILFWYFVIKTHYAYLALPCFTCLISIVSSLRILAKTELF